VAGFKKRGLALAACGLVAAAIGASPAAGAVPPDKCGTIAVEGKKFKVRAHKVSCEFAVRWSKHFLKRGHRPDGWSCTRYSADESSIAFNCRNGGKDYYAVRS
jgi:hypothetical protein